ncbi:Mtmr3 [Acrasis kona]|uniref:Mtmr3 n=1 Tax=Acrasis kona TaxID=1008807 RepID=A0AAW2Z2E9_9EUKA
MLRQITKNHTLLKFATPYARTYVRDHQMTGEQIDKEIEHSKKGTTVSSIPEHKGWSSNLASTSEAVVKAEHSEKKPFEQMQKESIDVLKKKEQTESFPLKGTDAEAKESK